MKKELWQFTNRNGDFTFPDAHKISRLYFPLANEAEFMSSITPLLRGDIKIGQNNFLMQPITSEDLSSTFSGRNFWIYLNPENYWSINGSPYSWNNKETVTFKAGILWHSMKRSNEKIGLSAEVVNFIPPKGEHVELIDRKSVV